MAVACDPSLKGQEQKQRTAQEVTTAAQVRDAHGISHSHGNSGGGQKHFERRAKLKGQRLRSVWEK